MKILIYAINGRGMGHLNRTLVLARALRKAEPDTDIRFIVGSPLFSMVAEAGFAVTKVPDAHHALGAFEGLHRRESHQTQLFDTLLEEAAADVFIIDFVVNPALFQLAKRHRARLALLYRKQRPEELARWRHKRCVELIDHFLLPHHESELRAQELPKEWRSRSLFLGPLARELDSSAVATVGARYRNPGEKLVVVSIGGGGFTESYKTLEVAEACAQRVTHSRDGSAVRWVIVYGPYYRGRIPQSSANVHRLPYEGNLLELFAAADLVVCNAGYNSIQELLLCATPGIVIPLKTTGRDDQLERARAVLRPGQIWLASEDAA
jgi:predicted glycosyltransferase